MRSNGFVEMGALLDALATEGASFVLDRETGQVSLAGEPEQEHEAARFVPVPRRDQERMRALLMRVGRELMDGAQGDVDLSALRARLLSHPRLRAPFRQAEREALLDEALGWLEALGWEHPAYELPPLLERGRERGSVGLIELLAIAAPLAADQDGPLRRRFRAASEGAARRAFARAIDELARLYAVQVDIDDIDRRGRCQIEGVQLSIAGEVIDLAVEVPRGLRRLAGEEGGT